MQLAQQVARDLRSRAPHKSAGLAASFGHAFRGLVEVVTRERNMKIHLVAGVALGLFGGELELPAGARLALLICAMLVLAAETFNGALEALVDLYTTELRSTARRVKDAAAAAVLVLSIGAVLVFGTVLAESWVQVTASAPRLLAHAPLGGALLLLTVGLLVPASRPIAADVAGMSLGAVLLGWLALRSLSLPFTALAMGLFALAGGSAWWARRHGRREEEGVGGAAESAPPPRAHRGEEHRDAVRRIQGG